MSYLKTKNKDFFGYETYGTAAPTYEKYEATGPPNPPCFVSVRMIPIQSIPTRTRHPSTSSIA